MPLEKFKLLVAYKTIFFCIREKEYFKQPMDREKVLILI